MASILPRPQCVKLSWLFCREDGNVIALAFSLCTDTHYVTTLYLVLLVTLLLCVSSGVAATILACVATICVEYCQYKVGKHIPNVCGQSVYIKSMGIIDFYKYSNTFTFPINCRNGWWQSQLELSLMLEKGPFILRCFIVLTRWSSEGAHNLAFHIALYEIYIKMSSWYQNVSFDQPQWAFLLIAGVEMPHVILPTK